MYGDAKEAVGWSQWYGERMAERYGPGGWPREATLVMALPTDMAMVPPLAQATITRMTPPLSHRPRLLRPALPG